MTYAEAPSAGHGRESFGCFVLKGKSEAVLGLIYIDSPQQNAFGASDSSKEWLDMERRVQDMAEKEGLVAKLESLSRSVISGSAQVDIYLIPTESRR
jgi:hypothetical protein